MSALGLDDRKNPGGVLHYAPRRLRAVDDESTIRPVLERLSRGEGRTPAPRMIRKGGGVAAMPPVDFEAAARNSLPIAARLAVAGGLVALMAALGAGIFIWPRTADHASASTSGAAPSAATKLPTPVHTVSIRKSDKTGGNSSLSMIDKDPARAPQMAPIVSAVAGAGAETAPRPVGCRGRSLGLAAQALGDDAGRHVAAGMDARRPAGDGPGRACR